MDMTSEQVKEVTENIERAGEFLRYLIDNPSEMEKIPSGSHIRFVDSFENLNSLSTENFTPEGKVLNVKKVYEYA